MGNGYCALLKGFLIKLFGVKDDVSGTVFLYSLQRKISKGKGESKAVTGNSVSRLNTLIVHRPPDILLSFSYLQILKPEFVSLLFDWI